MLNSSYRMDAGLEHLIRLQKVDEQIAQLHKSIADLPKQLLAHEEKLRAHKSALEETDKAIAVEDSRRRRLDGDLKDIQQKVLKYRGQSSSVKTNDEFRALQAEIDFSEAEIRRVEEQQIDAMEKIEGLESAKRDSSAQLAEQTALIERERAANRSAAADQQAKLAQLQIEREEHRRGVETGVLFTYDRISSSSRKTGLARVQGQRCLACQMYLRPQIWNQVRSGQLLACESCARLLYFDPALEPPPVAAAVPVKKKRVPKAKATAENDTETAPMAAQE